MKTKRGKCPYCCPDSGAIFEAAIGQPMKVVEREYFYGQRTYLEKEHVDPNSEEQVPVWKCRNCGMELKRLIRKSRPEGHRTPSQLEFLQFLKAEGWDITKDENIGSKVFVCATRGEKWFEKIQITGVIGACGGVKFTAYSGVGNTEPSDRQS